MEIDYYSTVSEAAKSIGVCCDTVRRWEKKGLIKANRTNLNHRLFSLAEIGRLHKRIHGSPEENNFRILKADKQTGFSTIELFAGCGGTALGFENAGLQHVLLNEINNDAVATLCLNRPKWNVIHDDVTNVKFSKLKTDVVQAGFPCQAFSYTGMKKGMSDSRGRLFFEFMKCVKGVKPKVALGENVRGLVTHDGGRTLKAMVEALEDEGYRVLCKILRAQYLDVPQKRERLIIMGVRKGADIPFIFPKEKDYTISIRETFEGCPISPAQAYPEKKKRILELIPPGGYWRDLPLNLQKEYMGASFFQGGGKTGMARRLAWDEPCLTLTCSPAQKQTERCHPTETRPLSIREYARIQTFPDEWQFCGSLASQYKQIGNAVPVNLAYHIGRCIISMLNGGTLENGQEYYNTPLQKPLPFKEFAVEVA